ncbi:MAG: site-2 protease family protein, partial [Clostridia bacterium]|nr:site-2 protease family protein [Clostridia bacterium]
MLGSLFGNGDLMEKLLGLLIAIITLLPALTFHEWAHGYMAYKLGDATAKADGRLSLNPLDH